MKNVVYEIVLFIYSILKTHFYWYLYINFFIAKYTLPNSAHTCIIVSPVGRITSEGSIASFSAILIACSYLSLSIA